MAAQRRGGGQNGQQTLAMPMKMKTVFFGTLAPGRKPAVAVARAHFSKAAVLCLENWRGFHKQPCCASRTGGGPGRFDWLLLRLLTFRAPAAMALLKVRIQPMLSLERECEKGGWGAGGGIAGRDEEWQNEIRRPKIKVRVPKMRFRVEIQRAVESRG